MLFGKPLRKRFFQNRRFLRFPCKDSDESGRTVDDADQVLLLEPLLLGAILFAAVVYADVRLDFAIGQIPKLCGSNTRIDCVFVYIAKDAGRAVRFVG